MSIKTWKEQFYPVAPKKKMTTLEAIEHSLRKWEGLRKVNLKRHGVFQDFWGDGIHDEDGKNVQIDCNTCALCKKFFSSGYVYDIETDEFVDNTEGKCVKCPLTKVLGMPCDHEGEKSPYVEFVNNGNPAPMISALKKALRMEKKND